MDRQVEKLLYSRADTAVALNISIRSVDYLISVGKLSIRRIGRKTSRCRVGDVRRFARADHRERIRAETEARQDETKYGTY